MACSLYCYYKFIILLEDRSKFMIKQKEKLYKNKEKRNEKRLPKRKVRHSDMERERVRERF